MKIQVKSLSVGGAARKHQCGTRGERWEPEAASNVSSVGQFTTLGNWRLTFLGDSGGRCGTQSRGTPSQGMQEPGCLHVSSQRSLIEAAPGSGDLRFPRTPSLTPRRYDGIW